MVKSPDAKTGRGYRPVINGKCVFIPPRPDLLPEGEGVVEAEI
jgi:hypothetical protein